MAFKVYGKICLCIFSKNAQDLRSQQRLFGHIQRILLRIHTPSVIYRLESSAPLQGAFFQLLRRAEGLFWPKGDFAGRTNGQTDGRTDNGFKGVRQVTILLYRLLQCWFSCCNTVLAAFQYIFVVEVLVKSFIQSHSLVQDGFYN